MLCQIIRGNISVIKVRHVTIEWNVCDTLTSKQVLIWKETKDSARLLKAFSGR